jgi:hypothetical protein
MANYPIPPWLNPSAAQGYGALAGEASRAELSAEIQREKMSQEAAQSSIEMQQRSQEIAAANEAKKQQLDYEHQMEQQKNAIEQQYRQQQIGLQTQDLDLAKKQFQAKTEEASKKFTANQAFQKAVLPKEQGGEGLTPTQAALKYMSPYMTGTELGRLAALPGDFKPGNTFAIPNSPESLVQVSPTRWEKYATIPQTLTNAPTALPVSDPEGNDVGHVIQIPGQKPIFRGKTGSGDDIETILKKRQQEKNKSTAVDTKKQRKAEGGYKIGVVYKGGLKYLGGDPNDESSWEKVK